MHPGCSSSRQDLILAENKERSYASPNGVILFLFIYRLFLLYLGFEPQKTGPRKGNKPNEMHAGNRRSFFDQGVTHELIPSVKGWVY